MSDYSDYCCKRRTIQQLPVPARKGHNAILNSNYLEDIVNALGSWSCQRILIVHSKALGENTDVVEKLKEKLGPFVVGAKSGVGAHSPYEDILEITRLLHETKADCLISIGSSSYSDASKIARLMHANLAPDNLTAEAMEALVDQEKGSAADLKDPTIKRTDESISKRVEQQLVRNKPPDKEEAALRKRARSAGSHPSRP
jgi:hypothetical protein